VVAVVVLTAGMAALPGRNEALMVESTVAMETKAMLLVVMKTKDTGRMVSTTLATETPVPNVSSLVLQKILTVNILVSTLRNTMIFLLKLVVTKFLTLLLR
jgi:hypothetical protein